MPMPWPDVLAHHGEARPPRPPPARRAPMSRRAGRRRPSRRCRRASEASVTSISRGASGSICPDPGGEGGVAVPALDDRPAVDRDDVAVLEPHRARGCRARSRRSATRRSRRGRRVRSRGSSSGRPAARCTSRPIRSSSSGGHPGPDRRPDARVHLGHDPPGLAHLGQIGAATGARREAHSCGRAVRHRPRSRRRRSSIETRRAVTSSAGAEAVDGLTSRPRSCVPGDQRGGLALVEVEPLLDRLGGVVGALHDLAAAVVAHPAVAGRVVDGVVGAAVRADPAAAASRSSTTSHGHLEVDHEVERLVGGDLAEQPRPGRRCGGSRRGGSRGCGCRRWSRRSSTTPTMISSGTSSPRSMTALALQPELGALVHRGAQHVAGGDVRDDVVARQADALGALARTLTAEQDQTGAGDHRPDPGERHFRKPS